MSQKKKDFFLDKKMLPIILFQRNELLNSLQKKLRRVLGRMLFTNLFIYFGNSKEIIGKKYFNICKLEFFYLKKYFPKRLKKILSIGCGVGGLEFFFTNIKRIIKVDLIDRNFISKKIIYGFDFSNTVAYNNLDYTRNFLLSNGFPNKKFEIFNYDKDKLPIKKYDLIISLLSLDFHYPFTIYSDYIKEISNKHTVLILDTNRPNYFKSIYKKVKIIKKVTDNIHPYCRIVCQQIID
jgi:hypothetical protein